MPRFKTFGRRDAAVELTRKCLQRVLKRGILYRFTSGFIKGLNCGLEIENRLQSINIYFTTIIVSQFTRKFGTFPAHIVYEAKIFNKPESRKSCIPC